MGLKKDPSILKGSFHFSTLCSVLLFGVTPYYMLAVRGYYISAYSNLPMVLLLL